MLLWLIWRSPNFFDHLEKEWEELARVYLFKGCREKGHGTGYFHVQDLHDISSFLCWDVIHYFDQNKKLPRSVPLPWRKLQPAWNYRLLLILATKRTSNLATIAWFVVTSWYYRLHSQTKPASSQKIVTGFLVCLVGHKQNCFCPSESTFYTMAVYKYSTSIVVLTICSFVVACFYKNHVQLVPRHPLRLATRDA